MTEILYKEESFAIMGAFFEVYNVMGCGFVEPIYQECLLYELTDRGIRTIAQHELSLTYKTRTLVQTYKPDFICYDKIIVEIKAVSELVDWQRAQIHNYLKATGYRLGLLVNFGHHPKIEWERIVR